MEIAENRLLKRLARFGKKGGDILPGAGDGGAVLFLSQGPYVFARDALAERTHFDFAFQRPIDVGRKAVYMNVSDLLAMGGEVESLKERGAPLSIIGEMRRGRGCASWRRGGKRKVMEKGYEHFGERMA